VDCLVSLWRDSKNYLGATIDRKGTGCKLLIITQGYHESRFGTMWSYSMLTFFMARGICWSWFVRSEDRGRLNFFIAWGEGLEAESISCALHPCYGRMD
jgi:hypothetical protein